MAVPRPPGAGYYNKDLMGLFAEEIMSHISEYNQQNLSNVAWAYGKLTHADDKLLAAIARENARPFCRPPALNPEPCRATATLRAARHPARLLSRLFASPAAAAALLSEPRGSLAPARARPPPRALQVRRRLGWRSCSPTT